MAGSPETLVAIPPISNGLSGTQSQKVREDLLLEKGCSAAEIVFDVSVVNIKAQVSAHSDFRH